MIVINEYSTDFSRNFCDELRLLKMRQLYLLVLVASSVLNQFIPQDLLLQAIKEVTVK